MTAAARGTLRGVDATSPRAGRERWLSRNLLVLCGVSFFQDVASELLYPILPIFLTVSLGAPPAVVGVVEGLAEGAAAAAKLGSGWLADRFRRRPLVAAGYGLAAVGKVVIALATVWPVVLIGRCVDRLGKGIRGAPRDALLVVDIPPSARGRAFGLHRAMDTAGAVVGPAVGLAGYELLNHRIRPLLVIAVIPAFISVALVAAVREKGGAHGRGPGGRRSARVARPAGPAAVRGLPRSYWQVVAVVTVFSLVNFPDALLLLRLHDIGFSVIAVIGAYIAYNAVYALFSYPLGALSDRLPRRAVFGFGLLAFAVTYTGLGLTRGHVVAWLLLAAYGVFTAATDGVGKAWISSLVDAHSQGRAQGVFQALTGGAVLLAGLWAGFAWGTDGRWPLVVSGVIALVLAPAVFVTPRRRTGEHL
jgi:MFS family permease